MHAVESGDGEAETDAEGEDVGGLQAQDADADELEASGDLLGLGGGEGAHEEGDADELQVAAGEADEAQGCGDGAGEVLEALVADGEPKGTELVHVDGTASGPTAMGEDAQGVAEGFREEGEGAAVITVAHFGEQQVGATGEVGAGGGEADVGRLKVAWVKAVLQDAAVEAVPLDADHGVAADPAGVALASAMLHAGMLPGERVGAPERECALVL